MSNPRLLASLSKSEFEHLMQRAMRQCLRDSDAAAALGVVAAEIGFELWLRERQGSIAGKATH